jgi:hypothetical protein
MRAVRLILLTALFLISGCLGDPEDFRERTSLVSDVDGVKIYKVVKPGIGGYVKHYAVDAEGRITALRDR